MMALQMHDLILFCDALEPSMVISISDVPEATEKSNASKRRADLAMLNLGGEVEVCVFEVRLLGEMEIVR
jgi:hypothetical protein